MQVAVQLAPPYYEQLLLTSRCCAGNFNKKTSHPVLRLAQSLQALSRSVKSLQIGLSKTKAFVIRMDNLPLAIRNGMDRRATTQDTGLPHDHATATAPCPCCLHRVHGTPRNYRCISKLIKSTCILHTLADRESQSKEILHGTSMSEGSLLGTRILHFTGVREGPTPITRCNRQVAKQNMYLIQ